MKIYDVIIIGAGAAGLMCAIEASKRGKRTLVIEQSKNVAEKIRISGGGRCNFTNLDASPANYISNNPYFSVSALSRYTQHDFIELVKKHGIHFHEKTLGQLFCDKSSKEIIDMLLAECKAAKVQILTATTPTQVSKAMGFMVKTTNGDFSAKSLVIASGGLSIPKIGASSFGYDIARQFELNIIPTRPGLVPFTLPEDLLLKTKDLIGVSFEGTACANNKKFSEGMIFTHRGLSGPAILQISSYWNLGEEISIDFTNFENTMDALKELRIKNSKQELKTVLSQFIPRKIAYYICEASPEKMADLSNQRLEEIAEMISNWKVKPMGTEGYRTAEVTLGGVDTDELSSKTFESKKIPGLYFIGEVVDVTGWLGGYNFQWAWSSGWCAGQFV